MRRLRSKKARIVPTALGCLLVLSGCGAQKLESSQQVEQQKAQGTRTIATTKVVSQLVNREIVLPADLVSFRDIMIYPKVPGFIDWIGVDRGSVVKKGDLLIRMTAPELPAQSKQSVEQASAARADATQIEQDLAATKEQLEAAKAKAKASLDTAERMKGASLSYSGIIAGNDLEIAQKNAEADAATTSSLEKKTKAIEAQLRSFETRHKAAVQAANSTRDIQSYLQIRAAFDGVVTERNVHEGSFVHPPATDTASIPLLRLQQLSLLRLVVPIPEMDVSGIEPGASVKFTVSAFPGQTFSGTLHRIAKAVDINTRTMAVELDVRNVDQKLTPGMFAEVIWPVRRTQPTLLVPQTSIVKNTERTFVVRVNNGVVNWVDVKPGLSADNLVEVFGDLHAGDEIAIRGSDELRNGMHVNDKSS